MGLLCLQRVSHSTCADPDGRESAHALAPPGGQYQAALCTLWQGLGPLSASDAVGTLAHALRVLGPALQPSLQRELLKDGQGSRSRGPLGQQP